MKQLRHFVLVFLVAACSHGAASAQEAADTTAAPPAEAAQADRQAVPRERVVVRRGQAPGPRPASIQRVRRRIRSIGGGGTVRQVVYPLIVVPNVQVQVTEDGRPVVPRQPGLSPRDDDRGSRYDPPLLDDPLLDDYYDDYYGERADRPLDDEIVRLLLRRQRALADSATTSADSLGAVLDSLLQERDALIQQDSLREEPLVQPRYEEPTPRQAERAILETGLFSVVGVNFEFNESALIPEARRTAEVVGETLRKYPELRLEVAGHTDGVGDEAYNQQLSQRRAEAVRQYLLETSGVAPARVTARGYGESQPLASNDTETGRALNRRVEFRLLNPGEVEGLPDRLVPIDGGDDGDQLEESLRRIIREEIRRAQQDGQGD